MAHDNEVLDATWKRVQKRFDYWVAILKLDWWDIKLTRNDSYHPEEEDVAADTNAKWEYRQAVVRVYLPTLVVMTKADLDGVLVHELVHVLIAVMEAVVPNRFEAQREMAVENIARAIIDAHGA